MEHSLRGRKFPETQVDVLEVVPKLARNQEDLHRKAERYRARNQEDLQRNEAKRPWHGDEISKNRTWEIEAVQVQAQEDLQRNEAKRHWQGDEISKNLTREIESVQVQAYMHEKQNALTTSGVIVHEYIECISSRVCMACCRSDDPGNVEGFWPGSRCCPW